MSDSKSVDELVKKRQQHLNSLSEVAVEIRRSARKAAILFVDLSDSTAMKEGTDAEVWLAYVFDFIRRVEEIAKQFGGTVVKRIGDELLLTFESTVRSDDFIDALVKDNTLTAYQFKVAADFGDVFFFRFIDHLEDDPYGTPVDRCARIAKLATAGTVVCTSAYEAEIRNKDLYMDAGPQKLAGITQPETIFVRRRDGVDDPARYLKPLLDSLNNIEHLPRYHFVSRRFELSDFQVPRASWGRPFLIRELLNVPKLALSAVQFHETIKNLVHKDEKLQYIGYMIEWDVYYDKSEMIGDMLAVFADVKPDGLGGSVTLRLPPMYFDVIRNIEKESKIRIRGVIVNVDRGPTLDFVDLALAEATDAPKKTNVDVPKKRAW